MLHLHGGPAENVEAQDDKKESPTQQAEKRLSSELGYTGMRILTKYRELFREDGSTRDEKKQKEFVADAEAKIREIRLSRKDMQLLRATGKYTEPFEFVNPFSFGPRHAVHFQVKINERLEIEPVTMYEMGTYD